MLGSLLNHSAFALDEKYQFNIPEQSLNNALIQFAADSELELIFTVDKIRGLMSNQLKGKMTKESALEQLLIGSGFTYQFISTGAVTIVPSEIPKGLFAETLTQTKFKQYDAIKVLNPLKIIGKSPDENRKSVSKTYQVNNMVSATKTDTPIREIPQSVHTVSKQLVADQVSLTVSESLRNVSGVTPGHLLLTPSFDFTHIRGFVAEQLLDGFTQYYNSGDRESLINVEKIEVLKGSNALLYSGGSGSPAGGLVNIVTKTPKPLAFYKTGVKYGAYHFYQPSFDINQPISNQVLFRLTGEYTYSESHIDVIETNRYNINPTIKWTNNGDTAITLQGKVSSWEQVDYQGLPAVGTQTGNFSIQPETYPGPKDIEPSHADFYAVWGTLEHAFNDRWSVSLKTRYAESEFDQKVQALVGSDGLKADSPLLLPASWGLINSELFQQQQELSFAGNLLAKINIADTEHKVLLGADYSQFKDQGFIESSFPIGLVDLRNPVFSIPYSDPGSRDDNIFVTNSTYGGYIQIQSKLFSRLNLLAGVRLGTVKIDYVNNSPGFMASAKTEKTKLLPRVGVSLELTDNISGFISYSEGMRGQPFVNFVNTPTPELSQQVESGIKFDFETGLSGQLVVYQIDRSHVALTDNSDPLRRSVTVGKQRSKGVEIDLNWQLDDEISLVGSYAYTEAKYINHLPDGFNGNSLPHIPEHSGKFWSNYRFPQPLLNGLSIGAGIYVQSGVYLETPDVQKTDGYYSIDAAINYELNPVKLSVSLKNLTNEKYFESLNYFGGRFIPAQPISAYFNISFQY